MVQMAPAGGFGLLRGAAVVAVDRARRDPREREGSYRRSCRTFEGGTSGDASGPRPRNMNAH